MIQDAGHNAHHALAPDGPPTMSQHQTQQQDPSHHMLMGASHMAHQRMGTPQFDTMTSMYQPISTPAQTHGHHPPRSLKRPRSGGLDMPVHALPNLEHSQLGGMQHVHMGGAYSQAPAPPTATVLHPPPTHHHHRLPDSEPSSNMMRREEGGGAPSVVGQEGMPEPAPRPKGPKLKFTTEDDQLLIELKEQKNLTWKQIADFFPGRSSGTLQVRYCTKLKAKTKEWNEDMDHKLRTALDDYENEKWRIVSSKLGAGFTPAACRERAEALWGGGPVDFEDGSSPHEASAAEQTEEMYSQHVG